MRRRLGTGELFTTAAIPSPITRGERTKRNDRWQERRQKLSEYFTIGVHRVWIVEPDNRAIVVFHSTTDLQQFGEAEMLQ